MTPDNIGTPAYSHTGRSVASLGCGNSSTETQGRTAEYIERNNCFYRLFARDRAEQEFKKIEIEVITEKSRQLGEFADGIFSDRWAAGRTLRASGMEHKYGGGRLCEFKATCNFEVTEDTDQFGKYGSCITRTNSSLGLLEKKRVTVLKNRGTNCRVFLEDQIRAYPTQIIAEKRRDTEEVEIIDVNEQYKESRGTLDERATRLNADLQARNQDYNTEYMEKVFAFCSQGFQTDFFWSEFSDLTERDPLGGTNTLTLDEEEELTGIINQSVKTDFAFPNGDLPGLARMSDKKPGIFAFDEKTDIGQDNLKIDLKKKVITRTEKKAVFTRPQDTVIVF